MTHVFHRDRSHMSSDESYHDEEEGASDNRSPTGVSLHHNSQLSKHPSSVYSDCSSGSSLPAFAQEPSPDLEDDTLVNTLSTESTATGLHNHDDHDQDDRNAGNHMAEDFDTLGPESLNPDPLAAKPQALLIDEMTTAEMQPMADEESVQPTSFLCENSPTTFETSSLCLNQHRSEVVRHTDVSGQSTLSLVSKESQDSLIKEIVRYPMAVDSQNARLTIDRIQTSPTLVNEKAARLLGISNEGYACTSS